MALQTEVRTVAAGAVTPAGLELTALFASANQGAITVPPGATRLAKVAVGFSPDVATATDSVIVAKLTGNGLVDAEVHVPGPACAVSAAGPLVSGGVEQTDLDVDVVVGGKITVYLRTSSNVTGDGVVIAYFQ